MEKVSKKTKLMITGVGIVAGLVVGGGAYASNQTSKKLAEAQELVTKRTNELESLEKEINSSFDGKSPSFLVANIEGNKVTELKNKVLKATESVKTNSKVDSSVFDKETAKVNKSMTLLEHTYKQQQAVNKLFQAKVINGSKVTKDLAIADDLEQETVDKVKNSVENPSTDFEKAAKELAIESENQLKQLDKAKQATEKVYKDNKVVSNDKKLYDAANSEVSKIKNAKAKKTLTDQLTKVKADIDKKAAEEGKKADPEKAITTDPVQQQNAATTGDTNSVAAQDQASPEAVGAGADYSAGTSGGADPGAYVPPVDNSGGYQAPAQPTPQAPANDNSPNTPPTTGGQTQNPPANDTTWDKPSDTTSNSNGGEDNYWGFD
jgi:hypothetical protein